MIEDLVDYQKSITTQQLSGKIVEPAKIQFTKFLKHVASICKKKFLEFDKSMKDH